MSFMWQTRLYSAAFIEPMDTFSLGNGLAPITDCAAISQDPRKYANTPFSRSKYTAEDSKSIRKDPKTVFGWALIAFK